MFVHRLVVCDYTDTYFLAKIYFYLGRINSIFRIKNNISKKVNY